jgi:hypothetical protein
MKNSHGASSSQDVRSPDRLQVIHANPYPCITVVSLFGVILIARPTAIFGSVAYPSTGLPVSPEGGVGGSRTNWGNIPTSGGGRGEPTPAQRVQAVMFALMGVCGSSGACESCQSYRRL